MLLSNEVAIPVQGDCTDRCEGKQISADATLLDQRSDEGRKDLRSARFRGHHAIEATP